MLPVRDHTVLFLSGLLHTERIRRGIRVGTRALGCLNRGPFSSFAGSLCDLGYEGEASAITVAFKKPSVQEPRMASCPTSRRPTTRSATASAPSANAAT